jgi:hypothetical protein
MSDPLEKLETEVLRKLELLSEGGTLNLDRPSLHRVHPGSTVPPGVDENNLEGSARPEVSLLAYHAELLEKARERGFSARLAAIAAAELDLETARKRPPAYIDPDSAQNVLDRDEAILRWVGKRAEWVAVVEKCSFSHVRKLRRLHKMNPATGEPREAAA